MYDFSLDPVRLRSRRRPHSPAETAAAAQIYISLNYELGQTAGN